MAKPPPVDYSTFDWIAFLQEHAIPYVVRGKNVARGHANVKCPLCAGSDPSEHMGLNLSDSRWGCWRDPSHRGKKPNRLIEALLNVDWKTADDIARRYLRVGGTETTVIAERIKEITSKTKGRRKARDAKDVRNPKGSIPMSGRSFHEESLELPLKYLSKDRKFGEGARTVCRRYGLRYVPQNLPTKLRGRILFPVVQDSVVRGFIGRSIHPQAVVRYMAFPEADALRDCIWNYDRCALGGGETRQAFSPRNMGRFSSPPAGKVLVICEGVFDAMKLDFYGAPYGVRAVAILGLTLSDKKVSLLTRLARYYEKVYICLDQGAEVRAREMASQLTLFRAKPAWLPEGIEDLGDFDPQQTVHFAKQL